MYKATCFCLLLLITGCSMSGTPSENDIEIPEEFRQLDNLTAWSADNPPAYSIEFEESQRFGDIYLSMRPMAPTLGTGSNTAVDDSGNVYLVNYQDKTINVYHPDGSSKDQIGRTGKGPGEFSAVPIIEIRNNRLFTYDVSLRRIQVFNLGPVELEYTLNTDPDEFSRIDGVRYGFISFIHTLPENRFLTGVTLNERDGRSYRGYYVMNEEGEVISDRVTETMQLLNHQWTLDNGMVGGIRLPFSRKGVLDVSDDGMVYSANTEDFLIKVYHPDEGYRRAIWHPFENDPLEEEEGLNAFHPNLQERIRDADFPDTWPALESIMVDDENRIWVSTIVEDKEIYRWWVLNGDGSLLGRFDCTRDEEIELVKGGHLYVREKDSEQGIEQVVRYRIDLQQFNREEVR